MIGQSTSGQSTRYSHGGDQWVLVQFSDSISLDVSVKALMVARAVASRRLRGVEEICVANASYMVRVDPDQVHPARLVDQLKEIEVEVQGHPFTPIATRIVDVPILFEDEWTSATVRQFSHARHRPDLTDLEFAAELNNFDTTDALIDAIVAAPALIVAVGFVPGAAGGYQHPRRPTDRRSEIRSAPHLHSGEDFWVGRVNHCRIPSCRSRRIPDVRDLRVSHGATRANSAGLSRPIHLPKSGDLHNYRKVDRQSTASEGT